MKRLARRQIGPGPLVGAPERCAGRRTGIRSPPSSGVSRPDNFGGGEAHTPGARECRIRSSGLLPASTRRRQTRYGHGARIGLDSRCRAGIAHLGSPLDSVRTGLSPRPAATPQAGAIPRPACAASTALDQESHRGNQTAIAQPHARLHCDRGDDWRRTWRSALGGSQRRATRIKPDSALRRSAKRRAGSALPLARSLLASTSAWTRVGATMGTASARIRSVSRARSARWGSAGLKASSKTLAPMEKGPAIGQDRHSRHDSLDGMLLLFEEVRWSRAHGSPAGRRLISPRPSHGMKPLGLFAVGNGRRPRKRLARLRPQP